MELQKFSNPLSKAGSKDKRPKLGDWRWVKVEDDEKKEKEYLLCCTHLASNHAVFSWTNEKGWNKSWLVRYRDLEAETREESNWKEVIEGWIEESKEELAQAVRKLSDMTKNAGLIQEYSANAQNEPQTLLPAKTLQSPEEHKKALLKLKESDFPAQYKTVESITQKIASYHRALYLPFQAEAEKLNKAVEKVDQRLFALELYAGLFQQCKCIRNGDSAPQDTPIAVRQMIRYMDEESLIDYDRGGMDYKNLEDFDAWIAKDENLNRIAPEQRCVVALKVRRDSKDYDTRGLNFFGLMRVFEEHMKNERTYLLLRNGTQVYRLTTEIEFDPRLLPLRDEFHKPFEKEEWHGLGNTKNRTITPDDFEYDKHVEERMQKIFEYNRVMFLVQGLLDRSKVFSPHPPINLADESHVKTWFKAVFDEELGLPSSNPPKWEDYRDLKNTQIQVGSFVWSDWHPDSDYRYERYTQGDVLIDGRERDKILAVTAIKKDRSQVRVSWPWGTRYGYEHRDSWDRSYGKWGEWEVNRMRHCWIPLKEVFNVSAYQSGEYKQFLCDAYLKGAYLKWAPPLLDSEKWHMNQKKQKKGK